MLLFFLVYSLLMLDSLTDIMSFKSKAMRPKLLIYCSIALLIGTTQALAAVVDQDDDVNKVDKQGRKQGKWIYFGKDRPSAGYPEEGKIEEGPYKDDRKEGQWTKYHRDGVTPKLKGEYHNNVPSGQYIKIYPNGNIREVGTFAQGRYSDSLKRYHEDGSLEYESYYNESGQEQGNVKYYYPNGQVEFEYESQNGTPTGKAVRYYENGDEKEVLFYDETGKVEKSEVKEMVNPSVKVEDPGISKEKAPKVSSDPRTKGISFEPNGYNKIYNANDEIWQDGEFKEGRLFDGKIYEYDADGILLKVRVFKKGVYHSDGQL